MGYKKYKRVFYRGGRDKYSIEQTAGTLTADTSGRAGVIVVPPSTTQGMRKVKHIEVSMATPGASGAPSVLYWAIVYVPQGTTVGQIQVDNGGGMYEPNQFVMSCGVFDFDAGPLRVRSPLSRNLNSGDEIVLLLQTTGGAYTFNYVVRYAITLQ